MNEKLADAIDRLCDCVSESEDESLSAAMIALADRISYGLKCLGNADAGTPMGAMEAHGKAIIAAGDKIAGAIDYLADAIRDQRFA